MTKSKGQWADQFKPDQIKGSTLNYNAALQMRYEKEIQGLVSQMTAQVERSIERFFKGELAEEYFASDASISTQAKFLTNKLTNTFESLFKKRSLAMAQRMVKGASKISKSALHSSLKELSGGLSINTGVVPSELEEVFSAIIADNVGLIKSIASEYLGKVQGAVMRSIQPGGNGLQDLVPFLKAQKGISQRKAKNLALDQTRRAFNDANSIRMQAAGIEEFEWIHSGGGAHPRQDHIDMSGKTFRFDNPPVIGVMYGSEVRGFPGQVPGCRCTMRPVIRLKG